MAEPHAGRPDPAWDALLRWGTAVVVGRSMLPTLRPGDRVLVRYGSVPRPDQLVVVRLGSVVAVKRVLRRDDDGWWVERDSSVEGVDSWSSGAVRDRDVLGVVVARLWPQPTLRLERPVRD